MSLGDYLRFLRALRGGPTCLEVGLGAGLAQPNIVAQIERRYREMGDDETLERLAVYFQVPVENLLRYRGRYRKALSRFLDEAWRSARPVRISIWTGETLTGRVVNWDMAAFGLAPADGSPEVIVQRHAVDDWEFETE